MTGNMTGNRVSRRLAGITGAEQALELSCKAQSGNVPVCRGGRALPCRPATAAPRGIQSRGRHRRLVRVDATLMTREAVAVNGDAYMN